METAEKEGRSIGIAEENMFRKEATRIYEEGTFCLTCRNYFNYSNWFNCYGNIIGSR